ncbi:Uncharacterized protein FWK35_00001746 [Aphis craccivora]|uniref:Uncharacterized protein n=1 Tax=Aphis craccivora TaxID=307492 RepID=A0A6G0ZNH0_APHCR|nr:Uncharacterized protein FWK35_00001746 [Aphis craccivora]
MVQLKAEKCKVQNCMNTPKIPGMHRSSERMTYHKPETTIVDSHGELINVLFKLFIIEQGRIGAKNLPSTKILPAHGPACIIITARSDAFSAVARRPNPGLVLYRYFITQSHLLYILSGAMNHITSRNNALISNFGDGFRWKSEYLWCIIEVKGKHFPTALKKIEKNQKKKIKEKLEFLRKTIQIFTKSVENDLKYNTKFSFNISRRYLKISPILIDN